MTQVEYIKLLRAMLLHIRSYVAICSADTDAIDALIAMEPEPAVSTILINGEPFRIPAGTARVEITTSGPGDTGLLNAERPMDYAIAQLRRLYHHQLHSKPDQGITAKDLSRVIQMFERSK